MVTERPTVADTEDGLIHVLIVDDHQMFAASLARVLNDEPDISVLATVESAVDAFEAMSEEIDVVLVDFRLGRSDGIETTRTLVASWPNVRVVMLTASNDEALLASALEAGCAGFITKSESVDTVFAAIRGAAVGEAVISPALLARILPRLVARPKGRNPDLTRRELEVLMLMAQGGSNQQIADQLFISRDTVRNHVASILSKLGVNSKIQAVTVGLQRGMISMSS